MMIAMRSDLDKQDLNNSAVLQESRAGFLSKHFASCEDASLLFNQGDGEVIGGSSLYDMWSNSKACVTNVKCWTNTGQKCFFFKCDVRPLQQRRATTPNKTAGWRPGPPCFFPVPFTDSPVLIKS